MQPHYNQIAGQNLGRLAALSDGVFAVAMTLLVLDIRVPAAEAIHSEQGLWHALIALMPSLVTYLLCFLTLGIFWVGQQTQLNFFSRSNRNLVWIHIAFLFAVSIMPFSTQLLAGFITYRIALLAYWLNILLLGVALLVSWRYAVRAGGVQAETYAAMRGIHERRIISAQALYAFGAALCVVNTYVSIAVIVVVQLQYAIAPRWSPLSRL